MPYLPDLSFGPDTRIVLIGNTECPNDRKMLPDVPHARRNIDQLSQLFTDPAICGLDPNCIVTIIDRDFASQIASEVDRAAKEATDTLLVYYVGHGLYGNADVPVYLVAKSTTESRKKVSGLSVELIRGSMRDSPARKRILILDCCYSGRAFDHTLSGRSDQAVLEPAIDLEGTFGIAAVAGNKKALAPPDEDFTRFTGALVDVLKRGVEIDDETLEIGQVFDEVQRRIGRKGDAPLPKRVNFDKGERFVIARNRFLRRKELAEIYAAIEGMRETIAVTGARLHAVETQVASVDGISLRLSALEGSRPRSEEALQSSEPVARALRISDDDWHALPAQPHKLHLRRVVTGRRNGMYLSVISFYLGAALAAAAGSFSNSLYTFYIYGGAALLACCGLLTAFAVLLQRRLAPVTASGMPFETNELVAEFMERRVVRVFGLYIDENLAWLSALTSIALAGISVLIWLNRLPTMVLFHP